MSKRSYSKPEMIQVEYISKIGHMLISKRGNPVADVLEGDSAYWGQWE